MLPGRHMQIHFAEGQVILLWNIFHHITCSIFTVSRSLHALYIPFASGSACLLQPSISLMVLGRGLLTVSGSSKTSKPDTNDNPAQSMPGNQAISFAYWKETL